MFQCLQRVETIENEYPALEERLSTLGLDKTLDNIERNKQTDLIRSDWCAVVERIRTVISQ